MKINKDISSGLAATALKDIMLNPKQRTISI